MTPDVMTLTVNGVAYAGFTEISASRAIDHCASDFNLAVTERWLGQDQPWAIKPFDQVTLSVGPDPFLTGYVDAYQPQMDARSHAVRIVGRSMTCDLIDCMPDIPSGQYKGYSLAQIARALCAIFGIGVTIDPSAQDASEDAVADATIERSETAFTFLERLARLAGVLLCDTPQGNLLLTRTGTTRAAGAAQSGNNIQFVRAKLDMRHRRSHYIVKGQSGIAGGAGGTVSDPLTGLAQPYNEVPTPTGPVGGTGQVQTAQEAVAQDLGVPRYRPRVTIAESQLTQAGMQLRATWQMHYAYGRSIEITARFPGWRQADGTLWALNQILTVNAPPMGISQDLLIVKVSLKLDDRGGRMTELTLAPPEGYTPDPAQVKLQKHKGKHGGKGNAVLDLNGLGAVSE